MFCSKCGNQLKDSDRFCAKCGTPVVKESELQEKPTGEPVYSQTPMIGSVEAQPVEKGAYHRPFSWRRAACGHSCRGADFCVRPERRL